MTERPPCPCGHLSTNPETDTSAVCPGCGRPLGDLQDTRPPDAADARPTADPPVHVVKIGRKSPPAPPPDVPGYEILGELGRGGMGVVYKAREKVLNRVVALKMILTGAHASEAERARFRKEAEAVAALHHAGIVQIYQVGEHAGQPFLVLEYVEGGNLADRMGAGDLMPVREAAGLVAQLAEAMQYAHSQGVIHRDLKPANILINADRSAANGDLSPKPDRPPSSLSVRTPTSALFKISDFGLAKKLDETVQAGGGTRTGAVMGTPSYISPEQAAGKSSTVTARSDVYSLGAILYELLTDRPPFKADTPLETVLQVINDDPVPPSRLRPKLPRDLETVCLKCLEKDPDRRYATAGELADDLGRFLRGEPIYARPVSAVARGWKWSRRHPALTVFGVTAVLALLAVVGVLVWSNAHLAEANRQKEVEAATAREQTEIARREKQTADRLAGEREAVLTELAAQGEKNRRSLYALQLAQVAGIVARDPAAALRLLDDPSKCPPDLRDFTWRYLHRLCWRAETVLTSHRRPVRAVAVSPDGLLVASADTGGSVFLWHPHTKVVYATLVGHSKGVNGVAFAPDGRTLATTSADGTLCLWHLPADLIETIRFAARFLPDTQAELNRLLPSTTQGLAVPIRPTVTLPAFGRGGRCVAFSQDGRRLAAGGSERERSPGQLDGVAKVWEVADLLPESDPSVAAVVGSGVLVAHSPDAPPVRSARHTTLTAHLQPVISLAFSPDGQTLATGSEDRGVILTSLVSEKREELRLHGGPVAALAYSPDGQTLATADNDEDPVILLWDVSKRRATERGKLVGHLGAVCGLAFAPDGRSLASVAAMPDATVRVWDIETALETARLYGHRNSVRAVGWLPDRRTLVSAADDATARVWQTTVRTNETIALFGDEPTNVAAAAVTASGETLVTADVRGRVRLWSVEKLFSLHPEAAELPVYLTPGKSDDSAEWKVSGLAVSADGTLVAVSTADGVRVWDLNTGYNLFGSAVRTVTATLLPDTVGGRAVQFSDGGHRLVTVSDCGVRVWDPTTATDLTPTAWQKSAIELYGGPLAISPDGRRLFASGRSNGQPGLLVADDGDTQFVPMPAPVTALDLSPDGTHLVTSLFRLPGRVWRVEEADGELAFASVCETDEPLSGVRYCREGKTLIGVRANRELVLLDAATGVERGVLSGHADRIVGVGLTPRDLLLVTVGRDGSVKRWSGELTNRFGPRGWFPRQTNLRSLGAGRPARQP